MEHISDPEILNERFERLKQIAALSDAELVQNLLSEDGSTRCSSALQLSMRGDQWSADLDAYIAREVSVRNRAVMLVMRSHDPEFKFHLNLLANPATDPRLLFSILFWGRLRRPSDEMRAPAEALLEHPHPLVRLNALALLVEVGTNIDLLPLFAPLTKDLRTLETVDREEFAPDPLFSQPTKAVRRARYLRDKYRRTRSGS